MGEGRGGGEAGDRAVVKKALSTDAHRHARTLRHAMTEAERSLWQILRARQTEGHRFRRQVPIGGFVADFVCHAARLIVEIDGGQHDPSSEEESSRTRFLEGEGYRVLRFWNNEVLENPEGVRSVIAEHLNPVTPTRIKRATPTPSLPHQGGGRAAAPSDLPDPAVEIQRLTAELHEAHEQQAAATEILKIINSSGSDLAPVFDEILEKAHTLCEAAHGALVVYDGEHFRAVALRAMPEPFGELLREPFRASEGGTAQQRLLRGEGLIHIPDVTVIEPTNPIQRASIDAGIRTLLVVALRKDDALLGFITAHRREVRPFSDKQIALLQNFAAQAVIAMENARLITETREALEQQTATAEVLEVINSSPGDLAPVFDAMLEKAMRLCGAAFGILNTYDGKSFHRAATRGVPRAYDEWRRGRTGVSGPGTGHARIVAGEDVVHNLDLMAEPAYRDGDPDRRAFVELAGARTALIVALRKETTLLGVIRIYRQEVRPFSEKQIALLQNFAAQAVIAMENARLLARR